MKIILECHDMDAAGALYNALRENLVDPEGFESEVSIVADKSGHNWVTGWFVKVEQVPTKKAPSKEEAH